ncbi:DUF2167 domain-containing protein [Prosthecobacter sp.]|uniref:DUF2167 domain-containing protein n=1 Tax=Prosthecobacter sp. TaxID=1965333 RepID=UPI001D789B30|nr:DUF2167 domain-containing protein [Prosthecobacter sp.]MCB1277391.1 DUF2167 domain-containing protein [Prosthecobacter sp.]
MKHSFIPHALLLACLAVASITQAQQPSPAAPKQPTPEEIKQRIQQRIDAIEKLGWTREGKGLLGDKAEIVIPKGYRFTAGDGTRKLMEMYANPATNRELGMLTVEGLGPWIIFEFDESGYVKDDEKDQINADEMMESLREGQKQGNEYRRQHGLPELEIIGWVVPPRYNEKTHNLEWGTRLKSLDNNGVSINYNTRLLGRKGVMEVTLVCEPEEMQQMIAEQEKILAGFGYIEGERYAEFREGDKVAKYGLTALIAGTGAFAAAKMGLFGKLGALIAKLGKGIILVVIGVLAAIKKFFAKLFGARQQPPGQ